MFLKADFHLHVDGPLSNQGRANHGEDPLRLAEAILGADLDVVSPLEHYQVGDHVFDANEALESLAHAQGKPPPLVYPATELSLNFDGWAYHVGIVFRDWFDRCAVPALPDRGDSLMDSIAALRQRYDLLAILFHPTWKDHQRKPREARTAALMSLPHLFDGVELINGSYLYNGRFTALKRKALITALLNHWAVPRESAPAPFATSDAHRASLVGSVHTRVNVIDPGDTNEDLRHQVFEAVRTGRTKPVVVDSSVQDHVRSTIHQMRHSPRNSVLFA